MRRVGLMVSAGIAVMAMTAALNGQNGTYPPDWTFKATSLAGTQQVGQATWRVENGEIVATPGSPDGGWLLLDKGYQDVQFSASYRCAGACTVGVMLRAEKTPEGMKGLYTVVSGDDHTTNAVVVDAQGKIGNRQPLTRNASGQYRFPPAAPPAGAAGAPAAGGRAGGGGRGGGRGGPGGGAPGGAAATFTSMFAPAPSPAFKPNDWNTFEVLADVDITGASVNGRGGRVAVDGPNTGFGPIALHVAGSGEVRFRNIALKDLNLRVTPKEVVSSRFRALRFEDFYYGWSAAAGDFNHDGRLDVTIANRYYLAPDFTDSREIYPGQPFNPAKEYGPAMVNFAFDYTGDGWDDVLVVESRPPVLYVNPKGEARRWTRYQIVPQGVTVATESIEFKDVNADGKPDCVFAGGGVVYWLGVDSANPTGPWKATAVSEPGPPGSSIHGIGAGDINGDGKVDILAPHGWWEQPAGGASQSPWKFHQAAFGRNGNAAGNFGVYDVNGDKLPDIVTALGAHGIGLVWYEQKKGAGESTWVEHQIMGDFLAKNPGNVTFTELHALTTADMDGDGIQDIITGKRHWAHLESYTDPDPMGAAVLYIFRTVRNPKAPGGAEFVPELVHNRSGVGSMIQTADMNKDGAMDIISGTNRGGYIFLNTPRAGARRGGAAPAPAPAAGRQ